MATRRLRFAKKMPHLSEEKREQIIAALTAHPNATDVTKQIGNVPYQTVWRLAKDAGIELTAGNAAKGRRGPPILVETREAIIAAFTKDPNARQVAKSTGATYGTVLKIVKDAGIELTDNRGRNRQSPERRAEIIRALEAEPNARAVARKIGGITHVGVWQIAKKAGIELTAGKAARGRHPRRDDQHLVGRAANGDAPPVA